MTIMNQLELNTFHEKIAEADKGIDLEIIPHEDGTIIQVVRQGRRTGWFMTVNRHNGQIRICKGPTPSLPDVMLVYQANELPQMQNQFLNFINQGWI